MIKPFTAQFVLGLLCFSLNASAEYGTSWTLSLGCPVAGVTSGSGGATISTGGFATTGGVCTRISNQFAKFAFSGATGGSLTASDVFSINTGKLTLVSPIRTTDTTPLLAVEAQCPTATREVNWIHLLSDATRTTSYFWGRSTMSPTATTMTKFYQVTGEEGFSGNYSLPVGTCSEGVISVSGSDDFLATIHSANDWSGFYNTSPGNTTFFAPEWTINSLYLGNKTWAGFYFNAQQAASSKQVRVTSDFAADVFTVEPLSDPETDTLDTSGSQYTETISIAVVNDPLPGMMRGTLSRFDDTMTPVGTDQDVACIVHDGGSGGFLIACAAKNPLDTSKNYALVFHHKPAAGSLDVTLNGTGKVTTAIGSGSDDAREILVQPDGRILVVGYGYNGANIEIALVRYNTDGSLDTSFNSTGKVFTNVLAGNDYGRAAVLQSDGKIVVAGEAHNASNLDVAVVRYNTDGSLDTTFNSTGKVTTAVGSGDDRGFGVALHSDGKIIVSGATNNGTDFDALLVRYTTNGSLDTTFNSTGIVATAVGSAPGTPHDYANEVTIQADGKIVAVGNAFIGAANNTMVLRYNSDGSLDTSFNSTGKAVTGIGAYGSAAHAVAIQTDDKLVIAGYAMNASINYDFGLVRYLSDGSLDTTFNSTGKILTAVGSGHDYPYGISMQSDGKIVVMGYSHNGSNNDFAAVRYNSDGSLDTSFNSTGKVTAAVGSGADEGYCGTIQSDGKILVGGISHNGSNNDFGITRFWP